MAEATFPERRTRSQLTLPDNILDIPDCSPLKGARTALRKHIINTSGKAADESDEDELLLSPGKKQPQPHMKFTTNTKRSASPPANDGYHLPSSPSEGRAVKRARRSGTEGNEHESHNESGQRPPSGHSRTHSDSKIVTGRRPTRQKSATTKAKKPTSIVSASPSPTMFSPAPTSPKKARAQSVPVFPTAHDIPRIDFRNPPPSPKRRSPSRSPSKDRELKLRILPSSFKLPTIPDDVNTNVNESDNTDISKATVNVPPPHGESNMDISWSRKEVEVGISDAPGTPSGRKRTHSSTFPGEIIPASPSTGEMAPASPPTRQITTSSDPTPPGEIIPASPPTPTDSSTRVMNFKALATPTTQSLNNLIPMSPLTPLPETPLPTKLMISADAEDRYASSMGWGFEPMKELAPISEPLNPQPAIAPSTSKSRLPRPSIAPPPVPLPKPSRPSTMAPPSTLPPSKKLALTTQTDTLAPPGSKASSTAPQKDAFALMMKEPLERRAKLEAKLKDKATKVLQPPPSIFASTGKGKEVVAAGSSLKPKMKLKEKMRPREKREPKTPFSIVLPTEGEEEKERNDDIDDGETTLTDVGGPSAESIAEGGIIHESLVLSENVDEDKLMDAAYPNPDTGGNPLDPDTSKEKTDIAPERSEEAETGPSSLTISQPSPTQISLEDHDTSAQALAATISIEVAESVAPDGVQTKEPQADDEELPETTEPRPVSPTGKSKVALGKKRQPASIPLPVRVTRSVSNKKNSEAQGPQIADPSLKKLTTLRPAPATNKRTASGSLKKQAPLVEIPGDVEAVAMVVDASEDNKKPLRPGSPMKMSPAKSSPRVSAAEKDEEQTMHVDTDVLSSISTPTKTGQPSPSPSPSKIARSTFLAMKPSAASIARTFSSSSLHSAPPNSSLFTLSNALEKLRMPAPSRPSTSMGFNRDTSGDDEMEAPARSKDDVAIGRASMGIARKAGGGIQRSTTLGSSSFKPSGNAAASSSKTSSTGTKLVQKPLSMFMSSKGSIAKPSSAAGRMSTFGNKSSIFGVGGGPRRMISKKTTLPVVIGSPVKGGGGSRGADDGAMREDGEAAENSEEEPKGGEDGGKIFNAIINGGSATTLLANLLAQGLDKGKGKESSQRPVHSSRRVSMLSRDLSQSLNALPPPPPPASSTARGAMGPPATPPTARRLNANLGSGSGSSASGSPSQAGPSGAKRSSARIANAAPKASNDGPISAGKKTPAEPMNPAKKILKDCVIFVDVKSEDGDEAGSLFVEMLEGIGARVLTRVGQTCTHIVFKNGLMSTITRYKLLRDPKPLVVGIGWVVECIERMAQVDETDFLIDLDRMNVAGHNKRRRSILPKLFAEEEAGQDDSVDGDRSMDGSVSSITMDDDLTPLERARRRKNKLAGH